MSRRRRLVVLIGIGAVVAALGLGRLATTATRRAGAQPGPGYEVVATFPHDPNAFTEGLAFKGDRLFEGTGLNGASWLRRVDLETGDVKRQRDLDRRYFGEGITVIGRRIFELTWQDHRAWAYRTRDFAKKKTYHYSSEGWGLTDHLGQLVMSDGTNVIRFRDPDTFEVEREIDVTDEGSDVGGLNELEWVEGEIYANVFPTDDVVRIDPISGEVVGRFNLALLHEQEQASCPSSDPEQAVPNGIAYMSSEQRLFVTGKDWCHVYEIELTEQSASPSPSSSGV